MGSVSNFCDCKNSSSNSCMNGLYFDEMQNMICPSRTWTNNSRKDFLTNRFNNNISLEELIKIQAVNKIIRVYREYKLYKQEKLKYNTCMNGNNIIIENNILLIGNNFIYFDLNLCLSENSLIGIICSGISYNNFISL